MSDKTEASTPANKLTIWDVLGAYAKLHETYPSSIMDAAWLPVHKTKMVEVFKTAWVQNKEKSLRDWIETGWAMLPFFQDGVGSTPIDLRLIQNAPPKERAEKLDKQRAWLKLMIAEDEIIKRDIDQFKKENAG